MITGIAQVVIANLRPGEQLSHTHEFYLRHLVKKLAAGADRTAVENIIREARVGELTEAQLATIQRLAVVLEDG